MKKLQKRVGQAFVDTFGRTSLRERLEDILKEAIELQRWTDIKHLREEAGDLACSLLAFFDETGLDLQDSVEATLAKIERRKQQYTALGRKTKVALLGGAFDPPTLGHFAAAQFVLDSSRAFDEVWLTPCYAHMFNKEMSSSRHRVVMCEIAARGDGRICVFDYEIIHQLAGETYHFLKRLLDDVLAQTYEFSYIIGMDNANNFHKWFNFAQLERLVRFVIVPRVGEEPDPKVDWYLKPPHLYLRPEVPLPDTASSQVREICRTAPPCHFEAVLRDPSNGVGGLISTAVLDYITRHHLYISS
ncbi:MAG: nicotinate-nicotinamide nucleotide adenylyltransferase [Promethearchaeota archaeon]|jgi:nicotinate-nucleotide adenylyltransferase